MLSAVSSPSASALVTMQSLRSLNKQVTTVQNQIATGKRVNTAKDDAAIWSLANSLKTDLAMNKEVARGLSMGSSIVAAASAGVEAVVEILQQMKSTVMEYQTRDVAGSAGTTYLATAQSLLASQASDVTDTIAGAEFQGNNLLLAASANLSVTINKDGDTISISKVALDTAKTTLTTALAAATDYAGLTTAIDAALTSAKTFATSFGVASKRIDSQDNLISALNNNLSSSISSLVDTNMDEASARLTALQTQQQLATQLLSITTQNQSSMLQTLFRGF